MLVDELRVSIPAQENTKIIEPSYNALELHAVHEKNGQWCLVLANMIEKSVLKALRALCRHGLPRPFGHAYAVERGPESHPARLSPKALDAIIRQFRKWSDRPKPRRGCQTCYFRPSG